MIPLWFLSIPINMITEEAKPYDIDPLLIAAIVQVESNGNTRATRYEPHFRYIYKSSEFSDRIGITKTTEEHHQMTSWGLMQVMGAVAREMGFEGHLNQLCEPEEGLRWGIKKLNQQWEKYGDLDSAIAAYNWGTAVKRKKEFVNQDYVDRVLMYYNMIRDIDYDTLNPV